MVSGTGSEGDASVGKPPRGRPVRILRFPLLWAIVGMPIIFVIASVPFQAINNPVLGPLVSVAVGIGIYLLIMRFWAWRATPELAVRGIVPETAAGLGVGIVYLVLGVFVLVAVGAYALGGIPGAGWAVIWTTLLGSLAAPVIEELIFRGLLLQALEQLLGSIPALLVTALGFGLMHSANPNATPWTALAVALGGGLLLTAAFLWRRSLWFTIGIHWAWNTLTGLLVLPGADDPSDGLFRVSISGPDVVSGGRYGIEASIVVVILGAAVAAVMLWLAHTQGSLTQPTWAKRQAKRSNTAT